MKINNTKIILATQSGFSRFNKILVYLSFFGLSLSGIIWCVFHYFIRESNKIMFYHHPLEHKVLVVHGIFGYIFIFVFGFIWNIHIKKWLSAKNKNIKSGIIMIVIFLLLSVTGLMLYYSSCEKIQQYSKITHIVLGIFCILVFLIHILKVKSLKKRS